MPLQSSAQTVYFINVVDLYSYKTFLMECAQYDIQSITDSSISWCINETDIQGLIKYYLIIVSKLLLHVPHVKFDKKSIYK